jgi:preprotein translocase subunit YajC
VLIGQAFAQTPASGPGGLDLMGLLPILLMFVVLWFIMIRPQMKRAKEHKKMVEELQKGDEIITAGGIVGRVNKLSEGYVMVEVADKVEIRVQRAAVQVVLPKGSIKAIE